MVYFYTNNTFSYFQIKLSGTPWHFVSREESCNARHLVREIITLLANNQYLLYGNSNLKSTADTLFFKYEEHVPGIDYILLHLSDLILMLRRKSKYEIISLNWFKCS